jgi:hypothetical protein
MTQSKWFAYLCAALLAATACSSSGKKLDFGGTCKVNSDCNDPLSCAFGSCHQQCKDIRDCPHGDRCVTVNGVGVCQLPAEASCSGTGGKCDPSLLCAGDNICRTPCTPTSGCIASQTCVSTFCVDPNESAVLYGDAGVKTDAPALAADGPAVTGADGPAVTGADGPVVAIDGPTLGKDGPAVTGADGPVVAIDGPTLGKDGPASANGDVGGGADVPVTGGGGSGGGGGGTGGVGGGGAGGSGTVTVCPQTQFGLVAEGDSNPNFYGGVGLRTATQLLNFTAYTGPDPNGPTDAGTSTVGLVYVQAFDPVSAQKQGPAQPLFTPQYVTNLGASAGPFSLVAAIAPTGQVAIIYWNGYGIGAAFLGPAAGDAGASPGNLQVTRQVQLEVSGIGSLPHVIWSVAFNAFVFSYQLGDVNQPIHVRKFFSDGRPVGGDTDGVPTDISDNRGGSNTGFAVVTNQNPYLGVFYGQYGGYATFLTVLDTQGNQVGTAFPLGARGAAWLTGAATSTGYVAFYDQGGIQASFISPDAKGNVSAAQYTDAGVLDGFHFNGTEAANRAIALNDDVGGAGGVGLAIAYNGKVSFAYVNPDHSHVNPATVVAHTWASGYDYLNISNSAGSFAVSLWSNAEHMVHVAATTCPQ